MPEIFLCYSREDIIIARAFEWLLKTNQISVFRDESHLEVGDFFNQVIEEKIKSCDAFVLLWSQNASQREFVKKEYQYAHKFGKKIFPVFLDSHPLPNLIQHIQGLSAIKLSIETVIYQIIDKLNKLETTSKVTPELFFTLWRENLVQKFQYLNIFDEILP
ncbi:toll/interleukin-1 receptor domain-containing protein, partial [candidate division KSB1 bacterium]|nr:toll/interleukin-1 receptor domain-containing protein [candidate division KSB1 bacterium]